MALTRNRSLERGLALIESLARNGAMSLADLHRDTRLPKSTIRRLLATLADKRFVLRSILDGQYRLTIGTPNQSTAPLTGIARIMISTALPHALDLTNAIGWPSDLHVRDGNCMRIVDSTRGISPFSIYGVKVDRRVTHFGSAAGMACLAAMSRENIELLYKQTEGDPTWGLARFDMTEAECEQLIVTTRERGYGTRIGIYLSENVLDDSLSAISVPLPLVGEPIGAISLLWPRSHTQVGAFALEHLAQLRTTAEQISADMEKISADYAGDARVS